MTIVYIFYVNVLIIINVVVSVFEGSKRERESEVPTYLLVLYQY